MNWNRSNYNQDDIAQMQHDAMKRVRDMQARAKASVNQTNSHLPAGRGNPLPAPGQIHPTETLNNSQSPVQTTAGVASPVLPEPPQTPPPPAPGPVPVSKEPSPPPEKPKGILASITGIFDALGLGQDHLILILLIFVLLSSEDSDRTLILALCYLLL